MHVPSTGNAEGTQDRVAPVWWSRSRQSRRGRALGGWETRERGLFLGEELLARA